MTESEGPVNEQNQVQEVVKCVNQYKYIMLEFRMQLDHCAHMLVQVEEEIWALTTEKVILCFAACTRKFHILL